MPIDISDLVLAMHPVGSFYFSADPTDPSIIFGGGGLGSESVGDFCGVKPTKE